MQASEANHLTAQKAAISPEVFQRRLESERTIAAITAETRLAIDQLILAAIKAGEYSTLYTWTSFETDSRDDTAWNLEQDRYAAYMTVSQQLESEGYTVKHTETNRDSSDDEFGWTESEYSLYINWQEKAKKRRRLLGILGNRASR